MSGDDPCLPEEAQSICLAALTIAAEGGKADIAKPKGLGSRIFEIVLRHRAARDRSDTGPVETIEGDVAMKREGLKDRLEAGEEVPQPELVTLTSRDVAVCPRSFPASPRHGQTRGVQSDPV